MGLTAGALIAGRYRAERCIGAGAMGEVWLGKHDGIGARVAIKVLHATSGSPTHEIEARFRREAYLLGRVRSDFAARVLDFFHDETMGLVLVMEFIEGQSLLSVMEDRNYSVEEAIHVGRDVAAGLADLHAARIVHRDVKPANIILQPNRAGQRAVLVDFGMGREMSTGDDDEVTGITRADMALGTLNYMAPEQILNSRGVKGTADIYALGAILYRIVMGRPAFQAPSDGELARKKLLEEAPRLDTGRQDPIAVAFTEVVATALKRRLTERYPSADEMLADFEELQAMVKRAERAARPSTSTPALPGVVEESRSLDGTAVTRREAPLEPKRRSPVLTLLGMAVSALLGVVATLGYAYVQGLPYAAQPAPIESASTPPEHDAVRDRASVEKDEAPSNEAAVTISQGEVPEEEEEELELPPAPPALSSAELRRKYPWTPPPKTDPAPTTPAPTTPAPTTPAPTTPAPATPAPATPTRSPAPTTPAPSPATEEPLIGEGNPYL